MSMGEAGGGGGGAVKILIRHKRSLNASNKTNV